jgi:hypothetical protein
MKNPMISGGDPYTGPTDFASSVPTVPLSVGADRARDLEAVRAAKLAADTAALSKDGFDKFNKK